MILANLTLAGSVHYDRKTFKYRPQVPSKYLTILRALSWWQNALAYFSGSSLTPEDKVSTTWPAEQVRTAQRQAGDRRGEQQQQSQRKKKSQLNYCNLYHIRRHDIQQNDTQHNDTQRSNIKFDTA